MEEMQKVREKLEKRRGNSSHYSRHYSREGEDSELEEGNCKEFIKNMKE